eukprot:2800763-Pleurochrysis_carterae.AAC.1
MGHGQAFTAVYAEGGICGISPATRSDVSDRQLCFTCWCRLPVKPIVCMGLRAILGRSTGSSRVCNSEWNLFMYIALGYYMA